MGARYYGRTAEVDRLVAVEVAPTAEEYGLTCVPEPVLIEADTRSTLDHGLGRELAAAARAEGLEPRHVVLDRYGSDASNTYADGSIGRAACIAIATDNTHGCEIAHLDAVGRRTLRAVRAGSPDASRVPRGAADSYADVQLARRNASSLPPPP